MFVQVCMLTCFPKLLYNFIYRGFSIRDVLDNPAEAARWLAARDLTIAATFCRFALPAVYHSAVLNQELCRICNATVCFHDSCPGVMGLSLCAQPSTQCMHSVLGTQCVAQVLDAPW